MKARVTVLFVFFTVLLGISVPAASAKSPSAPFSGCEILVTFSKEMVPEGGNVYLGVSQYRGSDWKFGIGYFEWSSKSIGWAPRNQPVRLDCDLGGDPYYLWSWDGNIRRFLGELILYRPRPLFELTESITIGPLDGRNSRWSKIAQWVPYCAICWGEMEPVIVGDNPRPYAPPSLDRVPQTTCQMFLAQDEPPGKFHLTKEWKGNHWEIVIDSPTQVWVMPFYYPFQFEGNGGFADDASYVAHENVVEVRPKAGVYCLLFGETHQNGSQVIQIDQPPN